MDLYANDVIIGGKLYTNKPDYSGFDCIDIATGNKLFTVSGKTISGAIHLPGSAYTQAADSYTGNPTGVVLAGSAGLQTYLFENAYTSWNYYNTITGASVFSFNNVNISITNGFPYLVDGTPLAFGLSRFGWNSTTEIFDTNFVWCWNMTKVVNGDWSTGIQWVKIVNDPATGQMGPGDGSSRASLVISADLSSVAYLSIAGNMMAGFNAKTGESTWNMTTSYTNTCSDTLPCLQLFGTNNFLLFDPTVAEFHCYSIVTGKELWSTIVGNYPWNTKGDLWKVNDNNNVYLGSPDGTITALSLADGHKIWQSTTVNSTEYITNVIPNYNGYIASDGKLYAWSGPTFSYQINPISRFGMLVCINATTGQTIFTLNGGLVPEATVANYLTGISDYDGNYYCLGKGQTTTSVEAPLTGITIGTAVTIQGSILDQSPAQPGTPAVADSAMSEWMDYLHMQNATLLNNPPKEQGVPVTLTAVDPNGNAVTIATVTTDSAGNYGYSFVPTNSGMYTITATFAGSNSYWPSSSETKLTVVDAPQATATAQSITFDSVNNTILMGLAVVGTAIIVAIVMAILLLRKRP